MVSKPKMPDRAGEGIKTYCIFSANHLPNIGGVERYTDNLARALAEASSNVVIVTNNVFGLKDRELLRERVEIVRLPCLNTLRGRYPLPRKNRHYRKLIASLESRPVDYVVVNTRFYLHSLEGIRLAERHGVRPIVIDHGSAHLTMGNAAVDKAVAWYEHRITDRVKRHDADYYAVSRASASWLGHFGIEAKGVLSNSIDARAFRAQTSTRSFRTELGLERGAFLAAFVGRFIPEKGIGAILEAARILAPRRDIAFALAGGGPLEDEIVARNPGNVTLLGKLESPDVAALLRDADAFVLPTRSEGFSTSLLETAACGTPPVVTYVGGVDELVPDERFGIVLERADGKEVAERIAFLCDHPDERERMGGALRAKVEAEFSWHAAAANVKAACAAANPDAL